VCKMSENPPRHCRRKDGAIAAWTPLWTAAMLIVGAGCDGMNNFPGMESKTPMLSEASASPFPDIPTPQGFRLVLDRASDYVDTHNRFGWHEFIGDSDTPTVRDFYRERLQQAGWKWLVEMTRFGERNLVFENKFVDKTTGQEGREWCWLSIKQLKPGKTRLRVTITPAPRPPE
jgi:hypothetical protein